MPSRASLVDVAINSGFSLQADYELLLRFVTAYEREKVWPGARPGWGEVQLASINPWELCRLPKPVAPPTGFNLTTHQAPSGPPAEALMEATNRLQQNLAKLQELGLISPGRAPGCWRVFYGKANVGGGLERDPTPTPVGPMARRR